MQRVRSIDIATAERASRQEFINEVKRQKRVEKEAQRKEREEAKSAPAVRR